MDNSMETYKLILIGDSTVGKTNLLTQYVDGKFSEQNISTVGIEFKNKIIELNNGRKFRLQIWDTSGQEKFMSLTKNYFRGCNAALFVFDVTNKNSFDNIQNWLDLYIDVNGEKSKKVLIGNKIDLDLGKREVDKEVAENFAKERGLLYFEISAKKSYNKEINDMFVKIVESFGFNDYANIKEKSSSEDPIRQRKIELNKKSPNNNRCC
jgi:small GTP-binding protein